MSAVHPLEPELALVSAASAGDEAAFRTLFDEHRRAIQVHCYRMLGSLQDAEDVTQETFLRGWRRLASFEGRASFRSWLYRIATNACLDALERKPPRVLPQELGPRDDPSAAPRLPLLDVPWLEPYPDVLLDPGAVVDARETIELAFLAAIQNLPPRQRAVLILRDVLHWSAAEVAELLGTSVPAVKSALQRARATMDERKPMPDAAGAAEERRLVERYARAWENADVAALVALLKEDATMTMPPSPSWYHGRQAIGAFLERSVFGVEPTLGPTRLVPTGANRQAALAVYTWSAQDDAFMPLAIKVFAAADDAIESIVGFTDPQVLRRFVVPRTLPA